MVLALGAARSVGFFLGLAVIFYVQKLQERSKVWSMIKSLERPRALLIPLWPNGARR